MKIYQLLAGRVTKLSITKLGLILMMGMSMYACAGLIPHSTSWKEEVLLHDGSKIIADRYYNFSSSPSTGIRLLDETITFTLPGSTKEISWTTEFRQDLPEPNSLGALLLDVVGGVPYLATSPAGCIAYNKWGRPNPPYILFKYVDAAWQPIPLKEFPPELVAANLMSMPASSLRKSYYTAEEAKAQRQNGNVSDYAKTILREAVTNVWSGCPAMVSYGKNGGWIGLDWFTQQPSLDACLKFCNREKVSAETCPCNSIFKGK